MAEVLFEECLEHRAPECIVRQATCGRSPDDPVGCRKGLWGFLPDWIPNYPSRVRCSYVEIATW